MNSRRSLFLFSHFFLFVLFNFTYTPDSGSFFLVCCCFAAPRLRERGYV